MSLNGSGWGPFTAILGEQQDPQQQAVAEAHLGDALCIQEHHLNGYRAVEQEQWCRQVGWSAVLTPGVSSVGAGLQRAVSSGTGVAVRTSRGMCGPGDGGSKDSCHAAEGRATIVHINGVVPGGFLLGSVYLDNDDVGEHSQTLTSSVLSFSRRLYVL